MGLFSRKRDTTDIDQLRDQIRQLSGRVDKANESQTELRTKVQAASESSNKLSLLEQRVADLDALVAERSEPTPSAETADTEGGDTAHDIGVDGPVNLVQSVGPPVGEPSELPAPTQEFAIADKAVLTELRTRLDRLEREIEAVDQRVTATSTELANQISEISSDLDSIDGTDPANAATIAAADETLEALKASQERLANEQARYQIAFREDLAELADRLKRHG